MNKTLLRLVTLSVALAPAGARAQTVQGDILRGEGRYLAGAGWYNFNTARAGRINVETWKAYNREVQRLYRDYMIDRSRHIQYKKGLTNKLQADIQRRFEEDQRRWRESPTAADISSGDALNAIAGDLADPSIDPSSWRVKGVDLPPGITLTALAFKVADPKKSRLQQSTVAIDRMLVEGDWPLPFRRPEIERECAAYKKAVTAVVEKCRKGTALQAADYDRLRDAVTALQKAVETAVPPRDNQRGAARDYVRRLDEASKIFAEQEYAEQLIRDVSEHKAKTVAELLAFMRDYRLLFADPGNSPEVTSIYEALYGLLRQQKDALNLRDAPAPSDAFKAGTVWVNTDANRHMRMRVVERNGSRFKAVFIIGKERELVREVNGEVGNDTISWHGEDTRVLKGPQAKGKAQGKAMAKAMTKGQGGDNRGTFRGNEIHVTFGGNGRQGEYTLRKAD
jgi:hypothetical protein